VTRDDLKGKIQTVLGPIEPADLGPTLMHEHLLWDITPPSMAGQDPGPEITLANYHEIAYGRVKHLGNYRLDSREVATEEVRAMRDAGGSAIVELTVGGLKPDPNGLAQISRDTGVHVLMGCGHYVEEYQDRRNFERKVDDFAREMIGQVFEGAWDTDVRAALIGEIGCQSPWTELERRVMHGAIIAQQETGAAINVHPGRHADQPQEVMEFVREHGGDTDRVIMSHIDRTIFDDERLLRLAETGCVLEFDLFGLETTYYPYAAIDMPNDGERLKAMRTLIDNGYLAQVVISHDICYHTRLRCYGGHGYRHIFANVIPLMRERAYSDAEIDAILVDNPRRLLTIQ
jgi:phosphotriesterase-related protein